MIETQPLLRVLDPNGHVDELRRRLRREFRSAESVLFVTPSAFQEGLCAAYRVALDMLAECHRHEKRWYTQQDIFRVLGGLETAYREKYWERSTASSWLRGYQRIWRRVITILERLSVEESSQSENRSAEALR